MRLKYIEPITEGKTRANKKRAPGRDRTRPKRPPAGRQVKIMELLRRLRAKALRKIGVSTTGKIYDVLVNDDDFIKYTTGKRAVTIQSGDFDYQIGDIIRLHEFVRRLKKQSGREAHFFIKDIIDFIPHISSKTYKILTLE